MTGKWLRRLDGEAPPSHSRARLALEDGQTLHYRDPRLFGRLRLVPGARFEEVPEVAALGPDPLEDGIDEGRLAEALARRSIPMRWRSSIRRSSPAWGTSWRARRLPSPHRSTPQGERAQPPRGEAAAGSGARGDRGDHRPRGRPRAALRGGTGNREPVPGLRPRRPEVPALPQGAHRAHGAGPALDVYCPRCQK